MDEYNQDNTEDTGETVEQFGATVASQAGYDPNDPVIKGEISKVVNLARSQMPGAADKDIIKQIKTTMPDMMKQMAPQFSKMPGFDATKYTQMQQSYNTEFGPDAAAATREKLNTANLGAEVGRNLNIGSRLAAGPKYQGVLNDQYNSVKTANEQEIMGDWETRRKSKLAEMEQMVQAGEINDKQVKRELENFALEQLRKETATKDAAAIADADPNSLVSQGARSIIEKGMPDVVKKVGDRWPTMSKAQILALLPHAEARIKAQEAEGLKQIDAANKDADRLSREKIASDRNAATRYSADVRANSATSKAGASGAPKIADQQRAILGENTIEKNIAPLRAELDAVNKSERLLAEAESILGSDNAPTTGPVIGSIMDTGIGKAFSSPERQRLSQISGELAVQIQQLQKGAQTEGDIKRYNEVVDMLKKDDPRPGILAARQALIDSKARLEGTISTGEERKKAILGTVGVTPPSAGIPTINDKASFDRLPSGAVFIDGRTGKKTRKQ